MTKDQLVYWGLVVGMILTSGFGLWGAFFSDPFFNQRAQMAEARLGKKATAFFRSLLRILSLLVVFLSLYLLFNLCRLFRCAIR